jgi:hypothetical protein
MEEVIVDALDRYLDLVLAGMAVGRALLHMLIVSTYCRMLFVKLEGNCVTFTPEGKC